MRKDFPKKKLSIFWAICAFNCVEARFFFARIHVSFWLSYQHKLQNHYEPVNWKWCKAGFHVLNHIRYYHSLHIFVLFFYIHRIVFFDTFYRLWWLKWTDIFCILSTPVRDFLCIQFFLVLASWIGKIIGGSSQNFHLFSILSRITKRKFMVVPLVLQEWSCDF